MKIDSMKRIGMQPIATVKVSTPQFQHINPDTTGGKLTTIYYQPGKQFLAVAGFEYSQLQGRPEHFDITLMLIFNIQNCQLPILTTDEHCSDAAIILNHDHLVATDYFHDRVLTPDSTTRRYQLSYKFDNYSSMSVDDVTVAVRSMRNKILRFVPEGPFESLDVTQVSSPSIFPDCSEYFWEEVNKQYALDRIIKQTITTDAVTC